MNPYNPNGEPGLHLVAETFGVSEVTTLNITYRPGSPLHQAATQVIGAAYALDDRHDHVTSVAKEALRLLGPVGDGKLAGARVPYAILRSSIPKLGDLIAQQDRAYDRLVEAISAYRRLLPESGTEHSTVKAHEAAQKRVADRDGDWAVEGGDTLRVLEAIDAENIRVYRTTDHGLAYFMNDREQAPTAEICPQTVRRLVAEGLLHQDTSQGPFWPAGQPLSLTPRGEAFLREARTATPRVTAALARSNAPASSGLAADSAAAPARTASTASHSR
ncbi:large ATP-binding protein [Streptomyces sp. NPDC092359]|uniref:large ATP-binding protein n=1 Tax=Streptomyces sp. NPDC092359 TaxID=3366014 RepID=UPI003804A627